MYVVNISALHFIAVVGSIPAIAIITIIIVPNVDKNAAW